MHPVKQLRKLINPPIPNQGKVVRITDHNVMVSTRQGMVTLQPTANDATRYGVGDTVILSGGVIVGRRLRQPTTYLV